MTGIVILACVSGFVLCCGLMSFLMMFQDITPSQNSYWWLVAIPVGIVGLLVAGAAALWRWLA